MMTIDTSAAAFLAGLVTSVHCVGMCGPLSCSWAISAQANGFMKATSLYHGGRLLAYAVVGGIAGAVGVVPLGFFQQGAGVLLPWLLVLVFALVGMGLDAWLPKPKFLSTGVRRVQRAAFRLRGTVRAALLGLATPLLPCGPLYVMFTLAFANGSPSRGAGFALAFGLGTLPLLWLAQTQLHGLGGRLHPVTMRRVQRGLALGAALVMAWRLRETLSGACETVPSCCHLGL
jgi:sulfite exporter TauE/SafE